MAESLPSEATAAASPTLESRATDLLIRLALLGLFVFWALDLVGPAPVLIPLIIWARVTMATGAAPILTVVLAEIGEHATVSSGTSNS